MILERNPRGDDEVMVIDRTIGQGDLAAEADGQANPIPNRQPPDYEARRQEHLVFAFPRAVRPISIVDIQIRPQDLDQLVLERRIEEDRRARASSPGAVVGDGDSDSALNVKIAPSLAARQRGRDCIMAGRIVVASGRRLQSQEPGQDVIPAVFIGGENAILDKKTFIRETVLLAAPVSGLPGWNAEDDFDVFGGDQFQSFCRSRSCRGACPKRLSQRTGRNATPLPIAA